MHQLERCAAGRGPAVAPLAHGGHDSRLHHRTQSLMVSCMIELSEDLSGLDLEDGSAFLAAAGLIITTVRPDRFEGYIELGEEHHQPWGIVHGGVYATAVESAASLGASAFAAERGQYAVGVNNNTSFLRPLTSGRVEVTAWPIQQGRTQQLWQVE